MSRQLVHKWRSEEHAILVGYNTIINDNPLLNVRDWKGENPLRIVIDLDNKLEEHFNVFNNQSKTIKITKKDIDLSLPFETEISRFLYKKNIQSVIVEGGKKTLNKFIENNLWDEARVFTSNKKMQIGLEAPKIVGKIMLKKQVSSDELKIIKPY